MQYPIHATIITVVSKVDTALLCEIRFYKCSRDSYIAYHELFLTKVVC